MTALPLLATEIFELDAFSAVLTFSVAFGLSKAVTNLLAGALSDRHGRKPVLLAGWLIGLPVPLVLIWAPDSGWVVLANVLLGVNQGLTWSTTVIMKIDLVGPARRGLALGVNEAAGYLAVAVAALVTGFLAERYGLRPAPFLFGLACAGLGLGLSTVFVGDTRDHAAFEASIHPSDLRPAALSMRQVFTLTSLREPAMSAASQAGLVNNLNDALAWGLLPIYYAAAGLSIAEAGFLTAIYPAVWGLGELAAGAWSDRIGRKGLIVSEMLLQALAIAAIASTTGLVAWAGAAALLGIGTAMVYPALLAVIGDVAHPQWRASAVGVYRLWRDLGFAVGAVLAGLIADGFGLPSAIWAIAVVSAISGLVVLVRMYETHPGGRGRDRPSLPRIPDEAPALDA